MTCSSKTFRPLVTAAGILAIAGLVAASSVLAQLGVTETAARDAIFGTLTGEGVYFPGDANAFRKASGDARAAMVTAVATFGRSYVQSDLFRKRYEAFLKANRPQPPETKSVDAEIAREKAQMAKGIADTEKMLAKMPADQRKEMEGVIRSMKAQIAALDSPERRKMMAAEFQSENAEDRRDYEERLKRFDADYPASVSTLVARRLQHFLDLSGTVDFSARLQQDGRFVKEDDENRSSDWKLLYRAGRPAVDAARAFARRWLQELKPSH